MKRKKLLSSAVAGMLVAAQMAMPVMAADGGNFDVNVTTKTGILRVEVPTTLAIAVDQFETTNAGTQIYSEEFKIANRSEVNVKVSVTSTATLGSNVTLAAKKSDVATATGTNGTAWLAVAAKKSASNYEAASGNDNFANLNEAAVNVATFAKNGTATTAAQTFYLKKGTANSAAYKVLKPAADKKNVISYAQFYELTPIPTQPTDNTTLKTAVDASDVYVGSEASGSETDKATLTKIDKGATVDASNNTWASGKVYYTAAAAATPAASVDASKLYVYGELTKGVDADAAFRYIGALSTNKEVWDSTDITKINIAYTIQGLKQSAYDDAASEIVYGLYKEKLPAKYEVQSGKHYISLDGKVGFAAAPTSVSVGGNALTAGTGYTFHPNKWIELSAAPSAGDVILIVVNGTTYKATVPTP